MKRIWIVGNGPSLRLTPLDLLAGQDSFATNRIHLIYPYTKWRPTHYYLVDYAPIARDIWRDCIDTHKAMGIPMWMLDIFENGFPPDDPNYDDLPTGFGKIPNTTYVPRCKKHHFYNAPNSKGAQGWHLPEICTAYNSVSGIMQVITMLGEWDEICLVGCDLGYVPDNTKNHFDPTYNTYDGRDMSEHRNRNAQKAHEICLKECPIPIYNCTIGGQLDVYPRRDIYEVLEKGE